LKYATALLEAALPIIVRSKPPNTSIRKCHLHHADPCRPTPWDAANVSLPLRFTSQRTNQTVQRPLPFRETVASGPAKLSNEPCGKPQGADNLSNSPPRRKKFFQHRVGEGLSRPPRTTCQLDEHRFLTSG
jgi:hypothetical protein